MTLMKYVGYLQLAILVACTVSCQPISHKKMVYGQNHSKEHTKMLREQMRNTFIRDVDVAGTVVDENGKLLKDVQLEKRIYDRNGTRLVQEVLKDGTFRAYHENAYEVSLTFLKHGHFRKMLRFMPHSPRNKYPPKYKEVDLDGGRVAIQEPNLKVLVENVGLPSLNVMREYRIEGVFNADGKSKGVLFKLNPMNTPEYRKRLSQSYQPLLNKEVEIDLNNIPDDCFYAKFPLTSGGLIEPVSKRIAPSNLSFSYHPSSSPKCITFGISGVGNGFIIPPVQKIDFSSNAGEWQKLMHRQLKEAPKTGYENEVKIFPSEEPGVLCYFKVKNYYGRTLLVPPRRFSDNRKSCLWKVRIYLKPDGTTNVRSTEEAWFDHHIKTSSTPREKPKGDVSYYLKGVVVDHKGEPVTDYTITTQSFNKFPSKRGMGLKPDRTELGKRNTLKFKKAFDIHGWGNHLYLTFQKPGYKTKTVDILKQFSDTVLVKDGKKKLKLSDMKIELNVKKAPNRMLKTVCSELIFNADGEATGYDIRLKRKNVFIISPVAFSIPADLKNMPLFFYVRAETQGGVLSSPTKVYLGVGGQENGIILADPKATVQEARELLSSLNDAPETGYKNEVELDLKKPYQCFFIRSNGYYGKGFCPKIEIKTGDTEVNPEVTLHVQPNGSTNVRTDN